jgi:hypothetical protein
MAIACNGLFYSLSLSPHSCIHFLCSTVLYVFFSKQVTLEQYPTSPHLTAAVVLAALQHHDIGPGRSAVDLGCGTGMLLLGWYVVRAEGAVRFCSLLACVFFCCCCWRVIIFCLCTGMCSVRWWFCAWGLEGHVYQSAMLSCSVSSCVWDTSDALSDHCLLCWCCCSSFLCQRSVHL